MLTEDMKKLISEHRAGMVASVNDDGSIRIAESDFRDPGR